MEAMNKKMEALNGQMTFTVEDEEAFYARRDELVEDFGEWLGDAGAQADGADDLGLLLDWKWGYEDGKLDRWSCGDLSEFLLYWCPRKLSAPADLVADMPLNIGRAMEFLDERDLLVGDTPSADLASYATNLREPFSAQMSDPANFGMAKSIFAQTGIEDPATLTPELLDQAMEQFNDLPEEARKAITDPALKAMAPQPADLGRVQLPEPEAVAASVERAPLLVAFDSLADYFVAPGKALTKTGAIKIADAIALAELLHTGDKYEHTVGEHVFRKQSARDFGGVDLLMWWAREVGVLRPTRGKLVTVKAWQRRRRSDPTVELTKAVDVLLRTGPIAARSSRFYMAYHEVLDESALGLCASLLADRSVDFDDLVAGASAILAGEGVAEPFPHAASGAVDRILSMLDRCGLITQSGVSTETGPFSERRVGGTVQTTPAGVSIMADLLGQYGYLAELLPPGTKQTAAGLVALSEDWGDLDEWWGVASPWLDVQPDTASALTELLEELHASSLPILILILSGTPEAEQERLAPSLFALADPQSPAEDSLRRVAASWLLERGMLDESQIDRDTASMPSLLAWGALCAVGHGEIVAESFAEDFDQPSQLELLAQIGRLLPPLVIDLLGALGEHHPDKRIAKAARKELFRVRSKLANLQQR